MPQQTSNSPTNGSFLSTPKKTAFPQTLAKSRHAITIGRSPEEIFSFIRNFENLPKFLKGIIDVKVTSPKQSHWVVQSKTGFEFQWDAVITSEKPGEMISWASLPDAEVQLKGTIWFLRAPTDLGTVVSIAMDYELMGGKLTEWIAFFGGEDPDTLTQVNLKRLKAFLEAGEIATVEGQPSGREEVNPVEVTH